MSYVTKSPWIIHYDGSSCNGCDIETLACLTPMYDVERFGMINTGNPKHADIFMITGAVNEQNISVIQQIYEQMPEPKVVVAIGICATSGGVFKECYNIMGGVDTVIPVDVYVPGCAARPEAIIDGVVKGLGVLGEKRANMKNKPKTAIISEKAEEAEAKLGEMKDDLVEAVKEGPKKKDSDGEPEGTVIVEKETIVIGSSDGEVATSTETIVVTEDVTSENKGEEEAKDD